MTTTVVYYALGSLIALLTAFGWGVAHGHKIANWYWTRNVDGSPVHHDGMRYYVLSSAMFEKLRP